MGRLFIPNKLDVLNSSKPKGICSNEEVIGCWGIEVCVFGEEGECLKAKETVQNYLYVSSQMEDFWHHTLQQSNVLSIIRGQFRPLACLLCIPPSTWQTNVSSTHANSLETHKAVVGPHRFCSSSATTGTSGTLNTSLTPMELTALLSAK